LGEVRNLSQVLVNQIAHFPQIGGPQRLSPFQTHLGKCAMVAHAPLFADRPMIPTRIGAMAEVWSMGFEWDDVVLHGGGRVTKRRPTCRSRSASDMAAFQSHSSIESSQRGVDVEFLDAFSQCLEIIGRLNASTCTSLQFGKARLGSQ
jgi:hypothetical protein